MTRKSTEEETLRFSSFVFYRGYFLFYQPLIIVLHFVCELSGSILCSLYLWIPAYAGMTGESLRNPVPELVEGCPALLSSSRMRGSILGFPSVFFRVRPWLILLLRQPSLTLPALNGNSEIHFLIAPLSPSI